MKAFCSSEVLLKDRGSDSRVPDSRVDTKSVKTDVR